MSIHVVCSYIRAVRKDPHRLDPPYVEKKDYIPRQPGKSTYREYRAHPPEIRSLEVKKIHCLDHVVKRKKGSVGFEEHHSTTRVERTRVFRALANWDGGGDRMVVLKVTPARKTISPDMHTYELWNREAIAYARLEKAGLSDAGYVPHCYGWYQFPTSWATDPSFSLLSAHPRMATLVDSETPPRALLIEYLEGASPISPWNITLDIAHEALRRLSEIHYVGILHCDVYPRNLLVTKAGQPVWIDFGISHVSPDYQVRRGSQVEEHESVCSILFEHLVSSSLNGLNVIS
ncbi:hypothetical protein SISNIDRAFT_490819 [Sistotremastrum niveocremeum HHB9708]|uniref:Protein kinase domain-containing protein n=1 Tax=Sistotremastrum niveocremeum HHB9708 TaxID=1314777 RepID=A0A164NHF4_9AGAM|nr:hypothetical protein SISNIDRAFT_490819 [Sistotremastrum niveocremeum HHB9708]